MSSSGGGYLKVYLLDDHDIVRKGLRDLLGSARDILVVGDSGKAQGAAESILTLKVHVMVLDLQLQDGTGVHVCRQVRAVDPSVQGLLVTSADDDDALAAAVLAGAAGFVVKLAHSSDIMGAIRTLGAGRRLMDRSLADHAASNLRARARKLVPEMSDHELTLLDEVLAGRTDAQIAEGLEHELASTQRGVAALVERLVAPARGSEGVTIAPVGKHRRDL